MILGQLRMGARQAKNAPLHTPCNSLEFNVGLKIFKNAKHTRSQADDGVVWVFNLVIADVETFYNSGRTQNFGQRRLLRFHPLKNLFG